MLDWRALLSLWWVLPFVAMLLTIAVCPLRAPRWWESNRNKLAVSLALGFPVVVFYLGRRPAALVQTAEEYASFIILLAGLYVISGGLRLTGDLEATPPTNTAFLALGAVLASLIGTTGASMLLVRALLQTNRERTRVTHTVIFFIFLVSNIGGMLTPLGDPPLFLGYLQGVPFVWTLRLWPHWLLMVAILLAVYFAWDTIAHAREPSAAIRRDRARLEPLRVRGLPNLLWLGGILVAVAFLREPWREALIVASSALSLWRTPRDIRHANGFTAGPMIEVTVLFLGILSGMASEVVGVPHTILAAISVGAVAMGANTYIGNAPNFMVKAIAEEAGVRMPSFLGYMVYSGVVLIPLFIAVTLVFF